MFRPPFCPDPDCPYHSLAPSHRRWYDRRGGYHTRAFGPSCAGSGGLFEWRAFYSLANLSSSEELVWRRAVGNVDRVDGGYRPAYVMG